MHRLSFVAVVLAGASLPLVAQTPTPHTAVLPGTRADAFTVVQGNALDSTNMALPDTVVRLRDARYGRIVDTTVSDKSGLFTFRAVDPGNYIVEMIGQDQKVVATS